MAHLTPHTVTCAHCGTAFTAFREDAKTCSLNCRVAHHRAQHKPTVTPDSNGSDEVDKLRKQLRAATVTADRNAKELEAARAEIDKLRAATVTADRNTSATPKPKPSLKPANEEAIQARIDDALAMAFIQWVEFGKLLKDASERGGTDFKRLKVQLDKLPESAKRAMAFVANQWAWDKYNNFVRERLPKEKAALDEAREELEAEKAVWNAKNEKISHWMSKEDFMKVRGALHTDRMKLPPAELKKLLEDTFIIFNRLQFYPPRPMLNPYSGHTQKQHKVWP